MCGRFQLDTEVEISEFRKIVQEVTEKFKVGEVAPTDPALVVTRNGPAVMRWGFAESFATIINATQEKAWTSSVFAESTEKRRIFIPTTGFYEWKPEYQLDLLGMPMKPYKVKYLFKITNEPILYLAGIYKECVLKDGSIRSCFAILTTAPNESMKEVHDRMPVILRKEELEAWMTVTLAAKDIMQRTQPELTMIPA